MDTESAKTLLLVGAHFDDCQCGSAAGFCRKLADRGWKAYFLNLFVQTGEPIVHCTEKEFYESLDRSSALLGAQNINFVTPFLYDLANDRESLVKIAKVIRDLNPEIICIPWADDNHYDHANASRAALKAISYMNILGPVEETVIPKVTDILAYELSSWQTRNFNPDFYVDVTRETDAVCQSVMTFDNLEPGCAEWYVREIRTKRASWGVRANAEYAEGLKYIGPRFPLGSSLAGLLGKELCPAGYLQYPWLSRKVDGNY